MYVCICNAITDKQIRRAAKSGASTVYDLQSQLGVAAGCGSCHDHAAEILAEQRNARVFDPVLYHPATA